MSNPIRMMAAKMMMPKTPGLSMAGFSGGNGELSSRGNGFGLPRMPGLTGGMRLGFDGSMGDHDGQGGLGLGLGAMRRVGMRGFGRM